MTTTLVASESPKPIDIRTVPNWTIPQIRYMNQRKGHTVIDYWDSVEGSNAGWVVVYIDGQGFFHGVIKKEDMNRPHTIALEWVGR